MLAEVTAGLGSLKAAKDFIQALNGAQTAVAVNDAKMTLQGHILDAQQSLFAAQEAKAADARQIAELKQEIVSLKDWTGEKERYHLVDADRGAMAYMPKPGMEQGEPAHWLCANCFNQSRKSFLQNKGNAGKPGRTDEAIYGCDTCKGSISVHWRRKPAYPGQPDH